MVLPTFIGELQYTALVSSSSESSRWAGCCAEGGPAVSTLRPFDLFSHLFCMPGGGWRLHATALSAESSAKPSSAPARALSKRMAVAVLRNKGPPGGAHFTVAEAQAKAVIACLGKQRGCKLKFCLQAGCCGWSRGFPASSCQPLAPLAAAHCRLLGKGMQSKLLWLEAQEVRWMETFLSALVCHGADTHIRRLEASAYGKQWLLTPQATEAWASDHTLCSEMYSPG